VNIQDIANAIAAYERTVISTNSAFDKYVPGDQKAMDEAAVRGMTLFKGKARCILCHNGSNFTDNQFHNLGVPQVGPAKEDPGRYHVTRAKKDKGAFKTLEEVVDFLNEGGGANQNLSALVKPLNRTPEEKTDLMAFLKALTGEPVKFQMPKLPK
jgi:cytochrome c peroxidase